MQTFQGDPVCLSAVGGQGRRARGCPDVLADDGTVQVKSWTAGVRNIGEGRDFSGKSEGGKLVKMKVIKHIERAYLFHKIDINTVSRLRRRIVGL
jgi:hypothetical protein